MLGASSKQAVASPTGLPRSVAGRRPTGRSLCAPAAARGLPAAQRCEGRSRQWSPSRSQHSKQPAVAPGSCCQAWTKCGARQERQWRAASKADVVENVEDKVNEATGAVSDVQDKTRKVLAKPLDLVAESLDERKDDDVSSGVLEKLFGHYHFDADQLKVIAECSEAIRGAAIAAGAVTALECVTTVGKALYGGNASDAVLVVGGVHVSNLTVILDYGFTAVLLFMAARSFAKVADDTSNQLRLVFQGLLQLGFVFMQFSTVVFALSIVQLMQAANRWPPIVTIMTGAAAVVAVVRAWALLRLLRRFPPGSGRSLSLLLAMRGGYGNVLRQRMPKLDKWALNVVGGLVLPLTMAAEDEEMPGSQLHPDQEGDSRDDEKAAEERATGSIKGASSDADNSSPTGGGSSDGSTHGRTRHVADIGQGRVGQHAMSSEEQCSDSAPYEFQPQEEQLLELVMNGMRVAGLALALEAISSFVLAVATIVKSGGIPNALWDMYNGLMRLGDQSLRASLLFMAAGFFCRAITSSGSDVENLMAALGGKGLSRLFRQTKKVTIGVSMGLVIGWFMSAYQIAQERGLVTLVVAKMGFA